MTDQLLRQMDRRPDYTGALGALAVAEEELQRLGADQSARWELQRAIFLVRAAAANLRDPSLGARWMQHRWQELWHFKRLAMPGTLQLTRLEERAVQARHPNITGSGLGESARERADAELEDHHLKSGDWPSNGVAVLLQAPRGQRWAVQMEPTMTPRECP